MTSSHRLSILSNARPADVLLDPYPHLVIRNALAPEVFSELEAQFPPDGLVVNRRLPVKDTWYDYPACSVTRDEKISPLRREFFAYHVSREFYAELAALLGRPIRQTYPDLEARLGKPLEELKVGMRPGGRGDLTLDLFEMRLPPRLRLRRRLENIPLAWRLAKWI